MELCWETSEYFSPITLDIRAITGADYQIVDSNSG